MLKHCKLVIETDHQALTFLKSPSASQKVSRWWASLQPYNIVYVRHVAGLSNEVADGFSRSETLEPISYESVDPTQSWLLAETGETAPRSDIHVIS